MMRTIHKAIPGAFAASCVFAALILAVPGVAVAHEALAPPDELPLQGVLGPAVIVILRFVASLTGVVPTSPLLLAAGATEGVVLGTLYALIGAQFGALAGFLIGRHLGRDFVERRGWLARVAQTRIGQWLLDKDTPQSHLMLAVFLCRLIPGLNMDALSYVAGITALSTWRFCLASFAALLPYTFLLVAAGQQLVAFGSDTLAIAVIGLVALSALIGLTRKHWSRREGREEPVLAADP